MAVLAMLGFCDPSALKIADRPRHPDSDRSRLEFKAYFQVASFHNFFEGLAFAWINKLEYARTAEKAKRKIGNFQQI